jgi:hypothetical protein
MDDLQKLKDLLNIKCSYYHGNCNAIATHLNALHKNNKRVDNEFFSGYLNYLLNGSYYAYDKCINKTEYFLPVLKDILKYIVPTTLDMLMLTTITNDYSPDINTNNQKYKIDLFQILIERNIKIPMEVLIAVIETQKIRIAEYLVNHITGDVRCLEIACMHPNTDGIINLLLGQKIQVTNLALKNAIISNNTARVQLLSQFGAEYDKSCLIAACLKKNMEIIKTILAYKIPPTKECFDALLQSCYYNHHIQKYDWADTVANIIDLLINHGYEITYRDVFSAMEHGCYINNIEKYNIKFEDNFMEKCSEMGFYPYKNLKVKPTMKCLYIECGKPGNVSTIKKLIDHGLKPDIVCLQKACDNRSNILNVKYLVETHKIKPDVQCLKNLAKYFRNSTLDYLLNILTLTEQKITKEEEHIEQEQEVQEEIIEEVKADPEPLVIKGKKLKNIIIVDEPRDIKKSNEKYKIVAIKSENFNKINKRSKYTPTKEAYTLFKLKENEKFTFLDIRKHIMKYISDNKLIDDNRKDLIKPDDNLRKLLKLKKNDYISFNDIDQIAGLALIIT